MQATKTNQAGERTPPWTSCEYSDGITELTLCTGEAVAWIEPSKTQSKSERRAIARLIMSAPALLNALKWMLSDMEHTAKVMNTQPECVASIVAARLAIAQAEGK